MIPINTNQQLPLDPYQKALVYFFSFPQAELTLNQLVSQIHISKTSASKTVSILVKEGFLIKKVIGKNWHISCNQRHPYNFSRKVAYFLGEILDSNLISSLNTLYPSHKAIILFGSYRKGDSIETSDLDIAVEVIGHSKHSISRLGDFSRLGYRKQIPITLHVFSRKTMPATLFANIANGIILDGFLEVMP